MRDWYKKLNPYIKAFIPIIFILIFVIFPILTYSSIQYKNQLLDEEKSKVTLDIQRLSSSLDKAINNRILLLNGLEGFVVANKDTITDENFLLFAEGLTATIDGIRNVIIAPEGINKFVYPIEGNESAVGHDLINDERQGVRESVAQTIMTRELVVSGPYELRQGGLGIIFRKAVFHDGDFWGLISEVLDVDPIFEVAGLKDYQSTLNVVIRSNGNIILGDVNVFDQNPVIYYLQLPQGQLEVAAIPNEGWVKSIESRKNLSLFFMASLSVLILVLIYSFYYRRGKLEYLVLKKTEQVDNINLQLIASKEKLENVISEIELSQFMTKGLVESSPDFVLLMDENKVIVDCSVIVTQILNVERDSLVGMNIASILKNDGSINESILGLESIIHEGDIEDAFVELEFDGELKYFSMKKTKMTKNRGYILAGHDVDEIKKQEKATQRSMEIAAETANIQSRFLANMSHEIRTPMNGILGMIELSTLEEVGETVLGYLHVAKESGNSLLTIIDDILDYSKLEVNKMSILYESMDLNKLINENKILYDNAAKEKNIDFTVRFDERIPKYINSDSVRIRQVLSNLLSNAFKFTNEGSVSLEVNLLEKNDEFAKISFNVRDTGIGISEDNLVDLFQRFNQLDDSITRKYGGTGLGLAVSQGLVVLMGGQIQCLSVLNEGSLFSFELDVEYSIEEIIKEDGSSNDVIAESEISKSILIVDDDLVNRKLMHAIVKKNGHRATLAEDGMVAVECCMNNKFDIILMDISMPKMDGFEAVKHIRKLNGYQSGDMAILAITAYALDGDKEKCLLNGFDDYISKPVGVNEVIRKISKWTK